MGHVNTRVLRDMLQRGVIRGVKLSDVDDFFCDACPLGKSHRLAFKRGETKRSTQPGEVIHSDVCGPMSVESPGGSRYLVTFKDDASGFRYAYFIKHKSDVVARFKEFETLVANKFGRPMKTLRSDNGREYCNHEMKQYLAARGIILETTTSYTPQQNGKSERDNRTIVESARTMIQAKNLPLSLWAEAVGTAVYVLNRTVSSTSNGKTPYEIWMGRTPNLSHLRVFGSEAYMHINKQFRKKFDPKAAKLLMVRYQGDSTNYRLYDTSTRRVLVSRDVIFKEKSFVKPITTSEEDIEEYTFPINEEEDNEDVQEEEVDEPNPGEEPQAVPRAVPQVAAQVDTRQGETSPRQLRDRSVLKTPKRYQIDIDIAEINPPSSFQEAMNSPEVEEWSKAIDEELEAHKRNETWTIVPRKHDRKPIDSKWVFKTLRDTSGKIYRHKARLCARGFLQKEGLDYTETFSPVVRYDSLRVYLPWWQKRTWSSCSLTYELRFSTANSVKISTWRSLRVSRSKA